MAIFTSKGENYRRLAADLRRRAAEAISPGIKEDLLVLAEQYVRLADEHTRAVNGPARQPNAAGD
jgi:hypothetical protein